MTESVPAARPTRFDALSFIETWLPRGDGLSRQDWQIRHTLLIWLVAVTPPAELLIALGIGRTDVGILVWTGITAFCCVAGAMLTNRRAASSFVALGSVTACAGLVHVFHGLTEAHFSFFVVVAALALYRDWTPFLVVLAGTVLHHAIGGVLFGHDVFDRNDAFAHPWRWAVIHGAFVLAAAAMQVLSWQIAEVEQRRSAHALSRATDRFQVAFQHAPVAMILCDAEGRIVQVNRALTWTMRTATEAEARTAFEELTGDWDVRAFIERREHGQQIGQREVARTLSDGEVQYLDVRAGAVRDDEGTLHNLLLHVVDVTESHSHEAELRRQAREDPLTKLLARPAFESDLRELVALSGSVSIVLVDIHRFTSINDQYGREAGDSMLKQLANRLVALAPVEALVARLAGDQFAIALVASEEHAQRLARGIVDVCRAPFDVTGGSVELSVVTGVSLATGAGEIEQVLSGAEVAVERAKEIGTTVQLYDDGLRAATKGKINAELLLREALQSCDLEERLPVWFQPIVNLETGKLVGAEALVRMRSHSGELIPPNDFVPVAEETGLVVPMGDHVLRQALKYLMKWGDRLSYVSVNVSPRQLVNPDFVRTLARRLADSGLADPSRLVLEITETSLLGNTEEMRHRLDAVKALGVRIALDDFGTGYSSLTWLQQVPADIVKLDRSFVAGLSSDTDKASIISAVIWLARSLNMSVVAEGVEEQADVDALLEADAGNAQGFLFSKPRDPAAFEQLMNDEDGGVTRMVAAPTVPRARPGSSPVAAAR